MEMIPKWLKDASAIVMIILIVIPYLFKEKKEEVTGMGKIFTVSDMTCNHCKATIEKALQSVNGITNVTIDVDAKKVEVEGSADEEEIKRVIQNAGYTVE